MELNKLAALVTGGASGVGLGVARALAGAGCRVVIVGRNQAKIDAAIAATPELSLHGRACDVSDREQVEQLFGWLAEQELLPSILVNSAGINVVRRKMSELDPADWDRMLAVNVSGAYYCIRAALPAMRKRKGGLIVNISSVSGKRALKLAGPAYCASKFAMTGLGTAVGLEEREHGIRVTNIYPGEINTPILEQRPVPVPPEKKAQMLQPEDLAQCVLLLARLPDRVIIPELVITPLYQEYA